MTSPPLKWWRYLWTAPDWCNRFYKFHVCHHQPTNQPTHTYDYWISINFENGCTEWIIVSFENVYWKWKTVVVWQARRKFNFPILQTFITIKLSLASPVNCIKCISFLLERIIICQNISFCLDSDFQISHGVKLKIISNRRMHWEMNAMNTFDRLFWFFSSYMVSTPSSSPQCGGNWEFFEEALGGTYLQSPMQKNWQPENCSDP